MGAQIRPLHIIDNLQLYIDRLQFLLIMRGASSSFKIMQLHWTLVCFLLSALVSVSSGYVMIEPSNPEAGEGNCLSKSYPLGTLKHGEKSFVEDECLEATCLSDGTINYEGCKLLRPQDNCKFVESDKSLSFPDCCKKIVCN